MLWTFLIIETIIHPMWLTKLGEQKSRYHESPCIINKNIVIINHHRYHFSSWKEMFVSFWNFSNFTSFWCLITKKIITPNTDDLRWKSKKWCIADTFGYKMTWKCHIQSDPLAPCDSTNSTRKSPHHNSPCIINNNNHNLKKFSNTYSQRNDLSSTEGVPKILVFVRKILANKVSVANWWCVNHLEKCI